MSNSLKYPCRCNTRMAGVKCTGRRSLRMKPSDYAPGRVPKCPHCNKANWRVDKWRIRHEMGARASCNCGGYWFVHRLGSKFCHGHPEAEKNHSAGYA